MPKIILPINSRINESLQNMYDAQQKEIVAIKYQVHAIVIF